MGFLALLFLGNQWEHCHDHRPGGKEDNPPDQGERRILTSRGAGKEVFDDEHITVIDQDYAGFCHQHRQGKRK